MPERFTIADLHLGHKGIVKFARRDGKTPLRPWGRVTEPDEVMSDAEVAERGEAHDEALIANWNAVVGPRDKVEVLGDVAMNRRAIPLVGRLNGRKRLRMGNHDIFQKNNNADYAPYFEEISAYKVMDDLILSHIPLHEESVKERWLANVHGHLHEGRVMMKQKVCTNRNPGYGFGYDFLDVINPRYLSVSCESVDFTPLHFDEVYARIHQQRKEFDDRA